MYAIATGTGQRPRERISSLSVRPSTYSMTMKYEPFDLAAVEDRDDVRMREPRGVRRLAPEALDELLVVHVPRVQHLDATRRPSSWSSAR